MPRRHAGKINPGNLRATPYPPANGTPPDKKGPCTAGGSVWDSGSKAFSAVGYAVDACTRKARQEARGGRFSGGGFRDSTAGEVIGRRETLSFFRSLTRPARGAIFQALRATAAAADRFKGHQPRGVNMKLFFVSRNLPFCVKQGNGWCRPARCCCHRPQGGFFISGPGATAHE